jgi:putative lipoprotein
MRYLTSALLVAALTSGCGSGISLDEPIEGPTWRLEQLGGEPVPPGNDPQRDAQLQFDGNSGRLNGAGGCNRVSGMFQRTGYSLRFSQLASTRMACIDPARSASETQFFAALQATASYRLEGASRLALLDASGRTLATLGRAAPR